MNDIGNKNAVEVSWQRVAREIQAHHPHSFSHASIFDGSACQRHNTRMFDQCRLQERIAATKRYAKGAEPSANI